MTSEAPERACPVEEAAEWLAKEPATDWGGHEWRLFNVVEAAEALMAERDQALAMVGAVSVKPLFWDDGGSAESSKYARGMEIRRTGQTSCRLTFPDQPPRDFEGNDAARQAKEMAQEYHERRVLRDLEIPTDATAALAARDARIREEGKADGMRAALEFIPTETVRCRGDKCRLAWCESCRGEDLAEAGLEEALQTRDAILAAIPQQGD